VKPALSVVFFTVSSGAGLGLIMWLLSAQLAGRVDGSHPAFWAAAAAAALLLTAGLLSSTRHLANPRNAWRAFARFRTSWLSREGVFAVALYPLAALHLWASASGSRLAAVTAVATIVLAGVVVLSTAMIYACLKTVPRWRTWHTPAAYLLYSLGSGALLWTAIARSGGLAAPDAAGVVGLLLAAGAVKAAWYAKFSSRVHATLNQALGVPLAAPVGRVQGRVRLLDAGHTHGTFLTHEFGFAIARERAAVLRNATFALTVPVPLVLLAFGAGGAWAAAVAMLGGLLVERWLFFALAEHVVRLYHGQRSV
jgi:DMSO reductase anchor subunit